MLRIQQYLVLLLITCGIVCSAQPSYAEAPTLFSKLRGHKDNSMIFEQPNTSHSKRVVVHTKLLAKRSFRVRLADGLMARARRTRLLHSSSGSTSFSGQLFHAGNRAAPGRFFLTIAKVGNEIGISGDFVTNKGKRTFVSGTTTKATIQLVTSKSCGADNDDGHEIQPERAPSSPPPSLTLTVNTVRVLVVVKPAVWDALGSGAAVTSLVDGFESYTNAALARSSVDNLQIDVVGIEELDTNCPSLSNLIGELYQVTNGALYGSGCWDQVRTTLRGQYQADVVTLLSERTDAGGYGFVFENGYSQAGMAYYGYNVVLYNNDSGNTFAHELGHNFGLVHDIHNQTSTVPRYPYGQGYLFAQDGAITGNRTIMAYAQVYSGVGYTIPCDCYSNPSVTFSTLPTGVTNTFDEALALRSVASTVANFCEASSYCPGPTPTETPTPLPTDTPTITPTPLPTETPTVTPTPTLSPTPTPTAAVSPSTTPVPTVTPAPPSITLTATKVKSKCTLQAQVNPPDRVSVYFFTKRNKRAAKKMADSSGGATYSLLKTLARLNQPYYATYTHPTAGIIQSERVRCP